MANKMFVLKMLSLFFSFCLIFVSCPMDSEKEEEPIEGPLFGLRFTAVRKLTAKEKSKLDLTAEDDGIGFFGEEGKENVLDYHAVKINDEWYTIPITTIGGTGDYWWYFGRKENLGKKMEKWEATWSRGSTYGSLTQYTKGETLREEKDFEYVDQESIKIDNQTYNYSLEQSKTKEYQINVSDGSSKTISKYFKVLRMYYDGTDNQPTLFIYQK